MNEVDKDWCDLLNNLMDENQRLQSEVERLKEEAEILNGAFDLKAQEFVIETQKNKRMMDVLDEIKKDYPYAFWLQEMIREALEI